MKAFRENPEGEENQQASKQNEREVFALKMQDIRANSPRVDKDGHCVHCYMLVSQCECWDSVNGGD